MKTSRVVGPKPPALWTVYLLECEGGVLYCGITNDLAKRFDVHACGKGAKFTRARKPLRIAASSQVPDMSAALKLEHAVKKQPRHKKIDFLSGAALQLI